MSRRYVPVATVQGMLRAEVIRSYLRSRRIPALLRYESVGRVLGITVDGLGEVQVLVPARLERQARRWLRVRRAGGRTRRVWKVPFPSRRHSRGTVGAGPAGRPRSAPAGVRRTRTNARERRTKRTTGGQHGPFPLPHRRPRR